MDSIKKADIIKQEFYEDRKRALEDMKFAATDKQGLSRNELDESVERFKNDVAREVLFIQGKELDEVVNRPAKPAVTKFKSFLHKFFRVLANGTEDR